MPGALYALWAWLFVCLGLGISILGPAIPAMRQQFGLSLATAGTMFTVHSAGYFCGVLVAGPLADRRGRKLVTAAGAALLALAMALAGLAPAWGWYLTAMVPLGLGFAAVDVGLNAAIGDAVDDPRRRAAAMNLLHGAFPLGTLAAPAGLALAWALGLDWRAVFVVISAFTLLAAAVAAVQRRAWPEPAQAHAARGGDTAERRSPPMIGVLREPRLVRLALIQGLYVGVELGIAGWIATYLVEEFAAGEGAGAVSTSVYWLGFLLGRPALAWITHRYGPGRVLPWMMAGGLVTGIAGVFAPSAFTATLAFLACGVAICGVFPTVMALALHGRRGDAGAVTALITAAASLGGLVLPWLVGAVAGAAGTRVAMAVAVTPLVVMLPLSWGSRREDTAAESAPQSSLAAPIHSL